MPLTEEQIVAKELEYFKSELANEPAFIPPDWEYENVDGKCVYKTEDGRKCAVGVLIKPAHYEESFDENDGTPVNMLSDQIIDYLGENNIEWLKSLQHCHDTCAKEWSQEGIRAEDNHFGRHFLETAKAQKLL